VDHPTCGECGAAVPTGRSYCSKVCGSRYRSRRRYQESKGYTPGDLRQCLVCAVTFASRSMTHRYCSDECKRQRLLETARRSYRKANPPKPKPPKWCIHHGCDRKATQRGLCDRCRQADRKWAGVPIGPQPVKLRLPPKRKTPAPREHGTQRGYNQHHKYGEPACGQCIQAVREISRRRLGIVPETNCRQCGADLTGRDEAKRGGASPFCSEACQVKRRAEVARDGKRRRDYRRRNATTVERFSRSEVFKRDGWRCQCCGCKCSPSRQVPHPKAPTLDHIIPLSKGGGHTRVNTQLLCFTCNSRKGDRAANDQLRLIG
jgi:predicted nucleic acid-binding Zn ribbon protein